MKFNIKAKIRVLCYIFLLIFIPSTLLLLKNLAQILIAFKKVVEVSEQTIAESQGLEKLIVDMETGERGFLITGEEEFLEPYNKANEEFDKSMAVLRGGLVDQTNHLELLEKIEHLRYKWIRVAGEPEIQTRRLIKAAEVGSSTTDEVISEEIRAQYVHHPPTMDDVISLLRAGTGKKIIDELRKVIDEFTAGLSENIRQQLSQVEKRVALLNFISLGICSASIVLSLFLAFMLSRSIINPIKALTEGTRKIGRGNLEHKINVNSRDEFAILSDSFNKMTEDLKRSKDELITAKDYTDDIIKSMADSLVIVDPDSKISMVNKATCDLLGYKPEELIGKDIGLLFPKEEENTKRQQVLHGTGFQELIERGSIKGLERTYLTKSGNRVAMLFSSSVMRNQDGSIRGLICLATDLSKLKQAEEAFRKSEEKLARSKKMESLGLLAGGVAHDLNNVLSGIVSYPEIILMDLPADSTLRKPIETMQESGQRAAAIVEDLLTVARGVAITKEPLNLNDLIREYLISPEFKELEQIHPAITIKANLHNDLFNVRGSRVHISKVVMNLVTNALEAIEGKGNVIISTANRYVDRPIGGYADVTMGEYVVLAVCDDGSGISSDDLERIFEPFYTKKVMGRSGTGLGLAVVWNLVQDHKGYIDITSGREGTTFELYLPITRDGVSDQDLLKPIDSIKGHAETILVVDDEENQREISCKMLHSLGYNAHAVSSGEAAVEYLKVHTVDLLLLDMIMDPGINGRETYERIIEIHPNHKAIIVSGFAETDEVKQTQRLGAGKYIKKPFTLKKMGLAVKEALGK